MKKIISLVIISFVAITTNAQINVEYGFRGGLNLSKESSHNYEVYHSKGLKFKAGVNVGGIINLSLSDKFDIEADALYSMQGYKDVIYTTHLEQNINNANYSVTSHYLNIPVSLKYYFVKDLYAECGPQVGFLLSKKDKFEGRETLNSYESSTTKKTDFSLLVGLGYRINAHFFVNGRYAHGFTGTSKVYKGGKNRNIQLSLGYMF